MQKQTGGQDLYELLEQKYRQYNRRDFIKDDPVLLPHLFEGKTDREIAGFLAATIAWGNRKSIIANGRKLLALMDMAPHDFVVNHKPADRKRFGTFVHRTFNGVDCVYFMKALQHLYKHHGGLEGSFSGPPAASLKDRIIKFRALFFETAHPSRTGKHISDPGKKSGAKRLCMFLRWMVRKDNHGVDFGVWRSIRPSALMLPLDIHTGNVSRKLGLLHRKQDDWQAVEEVTARLREFDPSDPVKYDFALFSMGVNNEI